MIKPQCAKCMFAQTPDNPMSYAAVLMCGNADRANVLKQYEQEHSLQSSLRAFCLKCRSVQWLAHSADIDESLVTYRHETANLPDFRLR